MSDTTPTVYTAEKLAVTLTAHRRWLYGEEGGTRADLTGADLRDVDLTRAVLTGADLTDANLRGANLRGANLRDANLTDANLTDVDLTRANLTRAVLTDANLRGANLRGAWLDTGETWETYLNETVPQLLLAGERGIEAIQKWGGHDWTDCPMHVAFNIRSVSEAPALLRPRVEQFVRLYDMGLIPQPELRLIADAEAVPTDPPEPPAKPKRTRRVVA